MKKIICIALAVLLTLGVFSACGGNSQKKLSIVTTVFPVYDWTAQILGSHKEETDLTMLLDSGVDLHSYQPTAADMVKISTCDLFLYIGGESDEWVADALKNAPNVKAVNLMEAMGSMVKEEETVEGMEKEAEEEEEKAYDEHIWLSLKNAARCVEIIRDALIGADDKNSADYTANAKAYGEKLNELDARYASAVKDAPVKTVVFGDRFPFRYLTDDYGLTYYAAFLGCSAESEASFETIAFLAKKVDELGLTAVLTLEGTEHKIAQTVVQTTQKKDAKILAMDSMQSVTGEGVKNGASYLNIMEKNLTVLEQALKGA